MKIYVMRHGETEANRDHIICGWLDSPLSENGVKLAALTGEGMKREGVHFDAAFMSPLVRAKQTCFEVLEKSGNTETPAYIDERITECYAGDWDAQPEPGFGKDTIIDPERLNVYWRDPFEFKTFPNGEPFTEVFARTSRFRSWLARQPYENVLVSTHGFAMMALLNPLWDNPSDFWQSRGLPANCSVNIIETDENGMRVIAADKRYY